MFMDWDETLPDIGNEFDSVINSLEDLRFDIEDAMFSSVAFEEIDRDLFESDELKNAYHVTEEAMVDTVYSKLKQMVSLVAGNYYMIGIKLNEYFKKVNPEKKYEDYLKNVAKELKDAPQEAFNALSINAPHLSEIEKRMKAVQTVFSVFCNTKEVVNLINAPIGPKDVRANKSGKQKEITKILSSCRGVSQSKDVFEKRKKGVRNVKRRVLFTWEIGPDFIKAKTKGSFKEHGFSKKSLEQMAQFLNDLGGSVSRMPKLNDSNDILYRQIKKLEIKWSAQAKDYGDASRFAICTFYIRMYDIVCAVLGAVYIAKATVSDIYRILDTAKRIA